MYGIDENVKESNVTPAINAGIQENIKIAGVTFAPLKDDGEPVIQVTFKDEFSSQLREILWEVNEDMVREYHDTERVHKRDDVANGFVKGEKITHEDAIKQRYELFNQRAKHIATKVMAAEDIKKALLDSEGNAPKNYAEFGKRYAAAFTDSRIQGTLLRLKVTLDKNDYSQLPTYPPFVESMAVPSEKSKLEITSYDRVTKLKAETESDDPQAVTPGVDLNEDVNW